MMCGPTVERVQRLARSPEWQRWKQVLRDDHDAHLIVADWPEERGWDTLADEARRTWTHEKACPQCDGKKKCRVLRGHGGYDGMAYRLATAHWRPCSWCKQTGKVQVVEVVPVQVEA